MNLTDFLRKRKHGDLSIFAKKIQQFFADKNEQVIVTPGQLLNWANPELYPRGVPVKYCLAIEVVTDGRITRKELRPNDFELFWNDL